jgi:hypothetical protein
MWASVHRRGGHLVTEHLDCVMVTQQAMAQQSAWWLVGPHTTSGAAGTTLRQLAAGLTRESSVRFAT